jgi:hypothetical protein
MYVRLAASRDEYEPASGAYLGRALYGHENAWLEGYIDRWLADPSKEHISVLGEFGTGKTWFALHYAWKALRAYRQVTEAGVRRPRVPLVIPCVITRKPSAWSPSFPNSFSASTRSLARLLRFRAAQQDGQAAPDLRRVPTR